VRQAIQSNRQDQAMQTNSQILNPMFFGKIVIATNSIGPHIYLRDGINGFLAPRNTPEAWQEAFASVGALSESARLSMENNARYTARVEFNEEKRMTCTLSTALEAVLR
jgi:glycosyltransferase involved in cell wall biosynthesis